MNPAFADCRLAALQMVSGPRVGDNLAAAGALVADAVAQGRSSWFCLSIFP